MKQLISVVYKQIVSQIKTNEINMVRLQGFDNPIIYKSICELFRNDPAIECFIPKLTLEKYSQFENAKEATWTPALMYMHKGSNGEYNSTPDALYANNSYVDFDKAITKWRNESPNLPHDKTALVLLMGTEAVPDDAGSLEDTTFVVSSANIIELLSLDYSEWFSRVLEQNSIESKESRQALHTLYRAIFANININIFKFSDFVDELDSMQFATCQELVGYICETLSDTWGIPSIINSKHVPKVLKLSKGKLSDAKIITSAVKFIERAEDIPSASAVSKLREKFSKYAEDKLDVDLPFPSDNPIFANYRDFEDCVIAFMRGEDLSKNRATLLQVDYAIIEDILGTKLEKIRFELNRIGVNYNQEMKLKNIEKKYSKRTDYDSLRLKEKEVEKVKSETLNLSQNDLDEIMTKYENALSGAIDTLGVLLK